MTDYTKLIERLRLLQGAIINPHNVEIDKRFADVAANAAAAIEELQAKLDEAENSIKNYKDLYLSRKREELLLTQQIPKKGEWMYDDVYSMFICSECKNKAIREYPYCQWCGAKMGVQE